MPVIDYKCSSCGSGMAFDSESGMLVCPGCGRKDNVESMADPLAQSVFGENEAKEYHCNSCGAVLLAGEETAATKCSFCGSAVVLGDRLTGKLAPAKVLPFAVSKEEAMAAFRKWCRNGLLTPSGFMTADRVKGITGMYVPFWLYDLHNRIEVSAHATKVRMYVSGDYQYTETQHYDVYRNIRLNYVQVPVDAAEKMNDELMDKLEPFPYGNMKHFKSPYLAGYIAEKYGFTAEELLPRAKQKISGFIESYIQSTMSGYATVQYTEKRIDTSVPREDYALLPVWVVHYDYDRLEYTFAMNGQTGKVVGKPPISGVKVLAWFAGISAVTFAALKLLSWTMGGGIW